MPWAVWWRVRWMRGSVAAWRCRAVVICGVGGAVVDEAQLPVGVGLVADGGDGLLEHVRRWVVDGGEHGDERSVGAVRGAGWSGDVAGSVGGHVARGGQGRLSVDKNRFHPNRPRDAILGGRVGSDAIDGQFQRRSGGRNVEVHLVSSRRSAVAGGELLGPQLATAPGPQDDGHRSADRPRAVAPVVGEQHGARGESDLAVQSEREGDGVAGGDDERAAVHPVGMHRPLGCAHSVVQPRPQRRQGEPRAHRPASLRSRSEPSHRSLDQGVPPQDIRRRRKPSGLNVNSRFSAASSTSKRSSRAENRSSASAGPGSKSGTTGWPLMFVSSTIR